MHIHDWKWSAIRRRWKCDCGEVVTYREFRREYSAHGNLDVDTIPALNRLVSTRKPEKRNTTVWDTMQ